MVKLARVQAKATIPGISSTTVQLHAAATPTGKKEEEKGEKRKSCMYFSVAQSSQRKNMQLLGVSIQRNVWACGQIVQMMAQMIEQGKERKGRE